jgi:GDP-4-dehydro-6-deoxy-D-mannose reductase
MFSRVLISGAAGFVGTHLTRLLVARGISVDGFGSEPQPAHPWPGRWHSVDVLNSQDLRAIVAESRPEAIVHLAGQASAGKSFGAPEETFRVNVLGTMNMIEAARAEAPRARVLVIGSGEAYGPQPTGSRVAEAAPFQPVSPYAFSKAVSDGIAAALASAHDLDIVRTRSFSHAGPGQSLRSALPSFSTQIAAIERGEGEAVVRVGNLDVTRDILDVRDVAECYASLLNSGEKARAYNVCSGSGLPLRQVVDMMIGLARVPVRVEVDPERVRPADVPYLVGDPARVMADTGWAPSRTMETTLQDLLDHCRRPSAEV